MTKDKVFIIMPRKHITTILGCVNSTINSMIINPDWSLIDSLDDLFELKDYLEGIYEGTNNEEKE